MNDFLKWLDKKRTQSAMHIEISYNKTCDWCIYIYKKGCAEDYPNSEHDKNDAIICNIQDCDINLAFAKAEIKTKEWFSENEGGY